MEMKANTDLLSLQNHSLYSVREQRTLYHHVAKNATPERQAHDKV